MSKNKSKGSRKRAKATSNSSFSGIFNSTANVTDVLNNAINAVSEDISDSRRDRTQRIKDTHDYITKTDKNLKDMLAELERIHDTHTVNDTNILMNTAENTYQKHRKTCTSCKKCDKTSEEHRKFYYDKAKETNDDLSRKKNDRFNANRERLINTFKEDAERARRHTEEINRKNEHNEDLRWLSAGTGLVAGLGVRAIAVAGLETVTVTAVGATAATAIAPVVLAFGFAYGVYSLFKDES